MVDIVSEVTYPLDPTGQALSNKVGPERHTLTSRDWSEFNIIIPRAAPFFQPTDGDLKLRHYPSGRLLVRGQDWVEGWYFRSAVDRIGKHIYGCIVMIDPTMGGEVEIEQYQTLGGEYTLNTQKLEELLAQALFNPFRRYWEVIVGLPQIFPPLDHEHPVTDMGGMPQLIGALNGIESAIIAMSEGGDLPAHLLDFQNPHRVTADHVQLGLVMNWAIATLADIQVGNLKAEAYMNPIMTYEMIKATAINALMAHMADHDNPHEVNSEDVNTYTKERITELLNQLLRGELGDIDADLLQGETSNQIIARAKLQTDAAVIQVKQEIINEISDIIGGAQAQDTIRFSGWTKEEWERRIVELAGSPQTEQYWDKVQTSPADPGTGKPIQYDGETYTKLGTILKDWYDESIGARVTKEESVVFTFSGGMGEGKPNQCVIDGSFYSGNAIGTIELNLRSGSMPDGQFIYREVVENDGTTGQPITVGQLWHKSLRHRGAITMTTASVEVFEIQTGGVLWDPNVFIPLGSDVVVPVINKLKALTDSNLLLVAEEVTIVANGVKTYNVANLLTALGQTPANYNMNAAQFEARVYRDVAGETYTQIYTNSEASLSTFIVKANGIAIIQNELAIEVKAYVTLRVPRR